MNEQSALKTRVVETGDWVSALFDGEMETDDDVARLGKSPEGTRSWSEYALIRDVLRDGESAGSDFMARFRVALADEPTVLAPARKKIELPRPTYWLAAAAAVAAITWTVLSVAPHPDSPVPMAANDPAPAAQAQDPEADAARAYLTAHQDYAHAVLVYPEMQFTQVSLAEARR